MSINQYERLRIHEIITNDEFHQKIRENNRPKAFIGLGGMGGRTVDELKGLWKKEIEPNQMIYFRVLDSDEADLEQLRHIDGTEKIHLHQNINSPLARQPWMDRDDHLIDIHRGLPQDLPQIGRATFLEYHNNNYIRNQVQHLIHTLIERAGPMMMTGIDIFLFTGTAGGSGAGIIVDLAYMIHHLFECFGFNDYRLIGYLYTHQNYCVDAHVDAKLKVVSYATLKHIDYFMSGTETYEARHGNNSIRSDKKIFDQCQVIHCQDLYPYKETTHRVASQLLDICAEYLPLVTPLDIRLYENNGMDLATLLTNHPQRRDFPRHVNYDYMNMGHISFIIPTKEVINYAYANIFSNIYRYYQSSNANQETIIQQALDTLGIETTAKFFEAKYKEQKKSIEEELKLITKREIREDMDVAYHKAFIKVMQINLPTLSELENYVKNEFDCYFNGFLHNHGPINGCRMLYGQNGLIERFYQHLQSHYEQLLTLRHELEYRKEEAHMAGFECTKLFAFNQQREDYFRRSFQVAWLDGFVNQLMNHLIMVYDKMIKYLETEIGDKIKDYASMIDEINFSIQDSGRYFCEEKLFTPYEMDVFALPKANANQVKAYLDRLVDSTNCEWLMRTLNSALIQREDYRADAMMSEIKVMLNTWLQNMNLDFHTADKLVMLAYLPAGVRMNSITDFNNAWTSVIKDQALSEAINDIANHQYPNQALWNESLNLPFEAFPHQIIVTGAKQAPSLSLKFGTLPLPNYTHFGDLHNHRIQITTQYRRLPLFNYRFIEACHETYLHHVISGIHMDARVDWRHMYHPFVEDVRGKYRQDIDTTHLMEVKEMVDLGFDRYGFMQIVGNTVEINVLSMPEHYEIGDVPEGDFNFHHLMLAHGCQIEGVVAVKNPLMIDMGRRHFDDIADNYTLNDMYGNQVMMVADLYKWIAKSKTYTDLIRKNIEICRTFETKVQECLNKRNENSRFFEVVDVFKAVIQTNALKNINPNTWMIAGEKEIVLPMAARSVWKYYLYHIFYAFYQLSDQEIQKIKKKINFDILQVDEEILGHIHDILRRLESEDEIEFNGKIPFTQRYELTPIKEDEGNPYRVLRHFYSLLKQEL